MQARPISRLVASTTLGLTLLLAPGAAWACSALACVDGYFYPGPGATVPANAPGFVWRPQADRLLDEPDDTTIVLRTDGAVVAYLPTDRDFLLSPGRVASLSGPLPPGAYDLDGPYQCGHDAQRTASAFTVVAPAPLPAELGDLAATDVRRGDITVASSGSCAESVPSVSIPIEVLLSAEAEPWADLLMYRTIVDEAVWRPRQFLPDELPVGGSWRGRGRDEIYAECGPVPQSVASVGLPEGRHRVWMQATLPGTSMLLETPPLELDLRCEASDDTVPEGDRGLQSGPLDAGGCACSEGAAPRGAQPWPTLALCLGVAVRVARRRRR